jgi:hypothetical protein
MTFFVLIHRQGCGAGHRVGWKRDLIFEHVAPMRIPGGDNPDHDV